jgi:hypothetical protein
MPGPTFGQVACATAYTSCGGPNRQRGTKADNYRTELVLQRGSPTGIAPGCQLFRFNEDSIEPVSL